MLKGIRNRLGINDDLERLVGVDFGAQCIRVVSLGLNAANDLGSASRCQVPLGKGAMNGAEIEDFDQVVGQLLVAVEDLKLQGCKVAFAYPSLAVRACTMTVQEYMRWINAPDADVIAVLTDKMQLPKSDWCFDWMPQDRANWNAVVARQESVMDRYALAEYAQLHPCVLDLDRLAVDRLFSWLCKHSGLWPQLWLRWYEGLLFAHVQYGPEQAHSRGQYCLGVSDVVAKLDGMLCELKNVQVDQLSAAPHMAVRFTGLQDQMADLMEVVTQLWPHANCLDPNEQKHLSWVTEEDWSVAAGLVLHPRLR